MNFYEKSKQLTDFHRRALINLIVSKNNDAVLSPSKINKIVDSIVEIFKSEDRQYYYSSKKVLTKSGKRKLQYSGRLYSKIHRCASKKRKLTLNDSIDEQDELIEDDFVDLNKELLSSLKTVLARDCSDWSKVKSAWSATFKLRQKELKEASFTITSFLESWPKFVDSRLKELVNFNSRIHLPRIIAKITFFNFRFKLILICCIRKKNCSSSQNLKIGKPKVLSISSLT